MCEIAITRALYTNVYRVPDIISNTELKTLQKYLCVYFTSSSSSSSSSSSTSLFSYFCYVCTVHLVIPIANIAIFSLLSKFFLKFITAFAHKNIVYSYWFFSLRSAAVFSLYVLHNIGYNSRRKTKLSSIYYRHSKQPTIHGSKHTDYPWITVCRLE